MPPLSSQSSSSSSSSDLISSLSLSLVREFLAKRRLTHTLEALYEELGEKPPPTTTANIATQLGIKKLVAFNKQAERPLDTLLEMIAGHLRAVAEQTGEIEGEKEKEREREREKDRERDREREKDRERDREKERDRERRDKDREKDREREPAKAKKSLAVDETAEPSGRTMKSIATSPSSVPTTAPTFQRLQSRVQSSQSSSSSFQPHPQPVPQFVPQALKSTPSFLLRASSTAPSSRLGGLSIKDDGEAPSKPTASGLSKHTTYSNDYSFTPVYSTPVPSSSSLSSVSFPAPHAITLTEAYQLKDALFGPSHLTGCFTDAWTSQGFYFKSPDVLRQSPSLGFALVQAQGGPCGILAVVQAAILKELLYTGVHLANGGQGSQSTYSLLSPSPDVLRSALINALSALVWRAGGGRSCRVVLKNPNAQRMTGPRKVSATETYKPDGLLECLNIIEISSLNQLKQFFAINLSVFQNPRGLGAVLLLLALVFSRSIEGVLDDRDDPTAALIGQHSYCTQEMVNLALTGIARSNVFNGQKRVDDSMTLRGIDQQAEIGFLSLFEHYDYIEVGSHLKSPLYPIWVLCSESHYTVLFSTDGPQRARPADGQREKFDLLYYDELANQNEEIRLTVRAGESAPPKKDKDLEPPINECIRTKWGKNARIDWNGTDPIL